MDIDLDELGFDPQPFIAAPLSSQPESEFYRTKIEPILVEMISKLEIDFFLHIGDVQLAYIQFRNNF